MLLVRKRLRVQRLGPNDQMARNCLLGQNSESLILYTSYKSMIKILCTTIIRATPQEVIVAGDETEKKMAMQLSQVTDQEDTLKQQMI